MPVLNIVDFVEYILDWSGQVEVLFLKSSKTEIKFFSDFVYKKEGTASYITSYIIGRKSLNRYVEISNDTYEIIESILKLEDLDLVKQCNRLVSF